MGKVYEHVQKTLQTEVDNSTNDPSSGPATRGFLGSSRGSNKLSPLRRQSSRLAPPPTPPALNAMQLMDQWSSFMDNGGISPTNVSRKTRTANALSNSNNTSVGATARNSYAAFWGIDTSISSSGHNNTTNTTSTPTNRKKSSVTFDRSSRNPSIFNNTARPTSAGAAVSPTGGSGQGHSQNPIANAIAQAIAYANATASNNNQSSSNQYNNNNNNQNNSSGNISYNNSNQGSFGIVSTPGDISSSMHNRAPFSSKYGGGLTRTAWQEHSEIGSDNDSIGFEHENYMNSTNNNGVQLSRQSSQSQLKKDTSLKLLNKAKISYREVMEG